MGALDEPDPNVYGINHRLSPAIARTEASAANAGGNRQQRMAGDVIKLCELESYRIEDRGKDLFPITHCDYGRPGGPYPSVPHLGIWECPRLIRC
jgi:hypothetical protein